MAGYQMPNVCKRIVLPIPSKEMTLQEYKETYGLDLTDFITFQEDSDNCYLKNSPSSLIYLVTYDHFYKQLAVNIDSSDFSYVGMPFGLGENEGELVGTSYGGIMWHHETKKVAPYEY